jgi:thiol:disulfide interchange protein DsbC
MMISTRHFLIAALLLVSSLSLAQTKDIEAKLRARLPQLPANTEITATPLKGLYELRIGNDLMYVDQSGEYLLQGALIELKTQTNLTESRMNEIMRVPFAQLPLKDGIKIVRGNGKRQLVLFEDPNCGYCKRLERDLASLTDITMTVMLIPVLGKDSETKTQSIWCAKDRVKAWEDWMMDDIKPTPAKCDTAAINRNLDFAHTHNITGTPTLFFIDGSRVPGAVPAAEVEKRLKALHP